MKLGLSDQIHINFWTGSQLEPVGPEPYKIKKIVCHQIQNPNTGQAL